ncbi:MAG: hypothetical protein L0Z62_22600 [Gemmataceae bacterium]|nr:hypothetical protein [Gemmataceae bacterium]
MTVPLGSRDLWAGADRSGGAVSLNGGGVEDTAQIDAAATFAGGLTIRRFESVAQLALTEFSAAEGLQVRR